MTNTRMTNDIYIVYTVYTCNYRAYTFIRCVHKPRIHATIGRIHRKDDEHTNDCIYTHHVMVCVPNMPCIHCIMRVNHRCLCIHDADDLYTLQWTDTMDTRCGKHVHAIQNSCIHVNPLNSNVYMYQLLKNTMGVLRSYM